MYIDFLILVLKGFLLFKEFILNLIKEKKSKLIDKKRGKKLKVNKKYRYRYRFRNILYYI
jgi:hypothetical protein